MKLAETIQFVLEIEGNNVYYSDVFINMLDDFGAFTEMPYAKSILKQMWDKSYHTQIAYSMDDESTLRYTISRIIDNLNANFGFDRDSVIATINELLQGLKVDLIIKSNNSSADCIQDVATPIVSDSHLQFQGFSMGNSIKSLSSLLVRNNKYTIVEDKGGEIQMSGEFAGIQSSFIRLDSDGQEYTKSITIGFYEENETLRSMKGQLLMTKLNLDYGQPVEHPIYGLKWLSEGGFVYIMLVQEFVAVIYMNEYAESYKCIKDRNNIISIESTYGIKDEGILNFLHLLKTEYNSLLTSVNGLALNNKKISKYDDGVQWDIKLGIENAKLIILKNKFDYDSIYSIRSILLLTEPGNNWHDLYEKYKFYQSCFEKLFGKPSVSSETFDEYYQGPGDEIDSLQEHSDGSFSSWFFNYAGVVLVEIRNAQVRVGYFHLPKDIDYFDYFKFMGVPLTSPKQEIINRLVSLGGVTDEESLTGTYSGYNAQYFLDEKFGKVTNINIKIDVDLLINVEDVYKNIRLAFINIYGEPDFETGPNKIGFGRYSKSQDWSSSFITLGGNIRIIWTKSKKIFLISFTDTILEQLADYSGDFHRPVLLNMFE